MRDSEVCNEDIIPSVQTSDPLEAFLVPTAPTWGFFMILSMPLKVSSVWNISTVNIFYMVNRSFSNNNKKANKKWMKPKDKWKRLKKKEAWIHLHIWQQLSLLKKTQKFIILKWNNCNGIWAKTKFTKTVCFITQNDIFHSNFNPVSYLEAFNNSQDH